MEIRTKIGSNAQASIPLITPQRPSTTVELETARSYLRPTCKDRSAHKFGNHPTSKLAELFEATRMEVGQFMIIQPKKVQHGDVEISNRMNHVRRLRSQLIGRPDNAPGFPPPPASSIVMASALWPRPNE